MRQCYANKPLILDHVKGESSKSIFIFMNGGNTNLRKNTPKDADDFERNRALLLIYPEWRPRMAEMASVSIEWAILVQFWDIIERLYIEDYFDSDINYMNDEKRCTLLIRSLLKSVSNK